MSLLSEENRQLLNILQTRFETNPRRHQYMNWSDVEARLHSNPYKLWSLHEMERTGGEPDVVAYDESNGELTFFDCAAESPAGRRSLCFDDEALNSRKENKPAGSALAMAAHMGIQILNEDQYRQLQQLGSFDAKTSSWIQTPAEVRKLGGALFADYRYGKVFVYHNGASSYYAARGFRGLLQV
jgi:hypothetical protein